VESNGRPGTTVESKELQLDMRSKRGIVTTTLIVFAVLWVPAAWAARAIWKRLTKDSGTTAM
jgi:hypothetical protein